MCFIPNQRIVRMITGKGKEELKDTCTEQHLILFVKYVIRLQMLEVGTIPSVFLLALVSRRSHSKKVKREFLFSWTWLL